MTSVLRKKSAISSIRPTVVVVAVEDHAALWWAGRARRVNEGEEVVIADLLTRPLERIWIGGSVLAAERAKLGERLDGVDVLRARGLDLGEQLVVLDEAADRVRVLEDVAALAVLEG